MRYLKVKVRRDVNTVYVRAVPEWDIPVLEQIFGDDGNVEVMEGHWVEVRPRRVKGRLVPREYPDAAAEYDRMTKKYGQDSETKVTYTAAAYGAGRLGVNRLRKAIEESRQSEEEDKRTASRARGKTPVRGAPGPVKRRRRAGTPEEMDALLS